MTLIAFMQAQNCSNYIGSWRHPASKTDFTSPEYFARIARELEAARFDLAFFDDRLAMPEIWGHSPRPAVEHGVRCVKMDPTVVLMVMAMATRNLGLGATCSTTYYEPFHVARLFQTLDLMTGGRVAWNIVTSLNDSEAANFGRQSHLGHDERYDRADEFVEIVRELWTSWERDALVLDKPYGRFADPDKVHTTRHDGRYFRLDGTFTVPQSRQGHPVLLQAGASGRGVEFAGRWADVVFAAYKSRAAGIEQYRALKEAAARCGRDPDLVTVAPAVAVITAETEELARRKAEFTRGLARPADAQCLLGEVLNIDFSGQPPDLPFDDEELAAMSWHSLRDTVIQLSGTANPTADDFVRCSGRGTLDEVPVFVGTPEQVADELEEWHGSCCDGFVLVGDTVPAAYEEFGRLVTPVLRRRGLVESEYRGATLRENLGLPMPERVAGPSLVGANGEAIR
ncbi:MAG: NtaA/DmoA family FMN-dependent monooxygenase [Ilumatobacteraceae bacterium]